MYNGSQLSQMTVGTNTLYFTYDASGVPMSVTYGDATYYYVTNVQGDVTGILNSNGALVVSYTYDAWGNQLSCTGDDAATLGTHNPLRYRGYVYDQETGLYYLQSRYYDPGIGRFINADTFASTGQGLLGFNMFVYCANNSVLYVDYFGTRYCAAGSVKDEKPFERAASCYEQRIVSLERLGKVVDITLKLNSFMRSNADNLLEYKNNNGTIDTWLYFYQNVTDGGSLDIKLQPDWKFEEGVTYIYNGIHLRYDDPGNINFGYVGAVVFPEIALCAGAGMNQISKYGFQFGDVFSFFDDPRDNRMIKYGYMMYIKEH